MTVTLAVLLYLIALVLAAIAAFTNAPRVNLLALAVAFIAAGLAAEILT